MNASKTNFNIEKFRVLAAIMVVTIHASSFIYTDGLANHQYYFIRKICDFGVIFFFLVSGYFLSGKKSEQILQTIKNTLKIYVFSSVSLIFLNITSAFMKKIIFNSSLKKGIEAVLWNINLKTVFSGEFGSFHFWFFSSLIFGYIFFYHMKKARFSNTVVILLSFLLYVLSLFKVIDFKQLGLHGGVSKAIFFMALGQYIYYYSKNYKNSLQYSFIFLFLCGFLANKYPDISDIFLIISAFFTVSFCKYSAGSCNFIAKQGKNTLPIYIFHTFCIQIVSMIYKFMNINKSIFPYLFMSICILLSLFLSPILYKSLLKIYEKLASFFLLEEV